ncbi:MAG: YkgJ family cysteine cluster protein, partial [Chloroflexi bacterium]|nr:YkgJ family cysteine cluster protein [Chloroflexota bacterium]
GARLGERANDDCIFFNRDHGCVVYEVRPGQCRTRPFWRSILISPEGWASASRGCPGMNQGQAHSIGEIEAFARSDGFV